MADSTGPGPGIPGEVGAPVRTMMWAGLRALGNTAALVAIYYLLPLDHASTWIAATILIIGLVAFIALLIFQVRRSSGRGSLACGPSRPWPRPSRYSCCCFPAPT